MLKTIFIPLLVIATALLSGENLDDYIPVVVQRKYGLNLLSPEHKSQIATWLKAQNIKPPQTTSSNLSLNIANGQFIQLDDGTVWEIDPSDLTITQGWLSPVQIEVSSSGNSVYPYRLHNTYTTNSVNARKVSMNAIVQ